MVLPGFYPDHYIYDRAAGFGKNLAQISQVSDGKTRLIVQMRGSGPSGRFGPDDFTLSADKSTLTCPNGVTSTRSYRSGSADGLTFRFTARDCAGCPIFTDCRQIKEGQPAVIKGNRTSFVSDYNEHVAKARAYNLTDQFREETALRVPLGD